MHALPPIAVQAPCPLDQCLAISVEHARIRRVLDEELGTYHGLSYCDFVLLTQLLNADGHRLVTTALVPVLGIPASAVVRQLLPLEKTGWLQRDTETATDGCRYVRLRPGGKSRLLEATQTAREVCAALV
ncbi:MAG: MarR family transcriptional regulator [Betaproteobacteria bacterium]